MDTVDKVGNVTNINVPYPQAGEPHVWISIGACRIRVVPGDGDSLVWGRYEDPSGALPLQLNTDGGTIRITQLQNMTNFFNLVNKQPVLELSLGKKMPFALTFETGASESHLDLGGLPLTRLDFKTGASKSDLDFSSPNPIEMGYITVSGGAGGIEVRNLANANFIELKAEGGASAYKLDFGGTLRRNAHVRIPAGMSSIDIFMPANTAAVVTTEVVLGGVDASGSWTREAGKYWTPPAVARQIPVLNIEASVALGAIHLHTT